MSPHTTRHIIDRRYFFPFNKLHNDYDGLTVCAPGAPVDLFHAHNRISFGVGRSIVSFESHLPRRFALTDRHFLTKWMEEHILKHSCRRLVAMSHFAERTFRQQHYNHPRRDELFSKLMVRHPSVIVPDSEDVPKPSSDISPLKLVFVGGHFARKGGCVAVRMAEIADQKKLPIEITIISSLEVGGGIWTDPTIEGYFDRYWKLLDLPNVHFMDSQPNAVVKESLRQSHLCLLPTLADTFGYSAIEALAEHTPVLATRVGALPEFLTDGVNSILIDLPVTETGEWSGLAYHERDTVQYAELFTETVDRLAEEAINRLLPFLEDRGKLAALRPMARQTALDMFDSRHRSPEWDRLYERVVEEEIGARPILDPELDRSSPNGWQRA